MATRKHGEKNKILPTSVRITETGKRLWDELAAEAGVSNAAYLETVLREKAKERGLKTEVSEDLTSS